MNRAGLLNFWYYDEETFDFEDGKLLLRVRFLNCPHRMEITFTAEGDAIHIHFEAWGKLRPGSTDINGTKLS